MFQLLVVCILFSTSISLPTYYNSLRLMKNNENNINKNTNISTTIVTTHSGIIKKAEIFGDSISDYTKAFLIIVSAVFGSITALAPLVYYVKKCYKNSCLPQCAWCIIKKPSVYKRRREQKERHKMALDHLAQQIQQNPSTIYTIA